MSRDRDAAGRPRNARPRDALGRPLPRTPAAEPPADEPALPPRQALASAQALLLAGQPFTAHEVLEAVWKATTGDERALWRGLAQLCVGLTHARRGNLVGAQALLSRAARTLEDAPASYGVDPAGLAAWARHAARTPDPEASPQLVNDLGS